jgi:hypothetical protein
MADTEPRAAADGPVTTRDIAEFTRHLARLRTPGLGGDPAALAAFLAHKAELFARIAAQHADTDWVSPRTVETSPMRRGDGRGAAEVR